MSKFIDLTGQRFGRLTVLRRAENIGIYTAWECLFDCGNKKIIRGNSIKSGMTRSCGCLYSEKKRNKKHGLSKTKLHGIWRSMKSRCYNNNTAVFKNYGGRGITVCQEWINDFYSFWQWALANGYKEGLSIERIDNDKGYSPDNCRWATPKEQTRNRRKTLIINGKSIGEWSDILGVNYNILFNRFKKGHLECFQK